MKIKYAGFWLYVRVSLFARNIDICLDEKLLYKQASVYFACSGSEWGGVYVSCPALNTKSIEDIQQHVFAMQVAQHIAKDMKQFLIDINYEESKDA